MKYQVHYTDTVIKTLKKLDRSIVALLMGYINKNLQDTENPRKMGKSLVGNHQGKWRYRVGDYRILCEITDDTITILVVAIGHRKDIYE